ncbi:Aminotransferase-like, plant mobile domain [Sesbania bispinosa]|nr:Aminotransferase-like, plant mobile domain [Sesbania bispinosa]
MVRSRLSCSEPLLGDSSSSTDTDMEDSSSELIPKAIFLIAWTRLPPTRANPIDASGRKWMTERHPSVRPFPPAPPSGDDFFRDSLVTLVIHQEDALLFHDVPNTPTHLVGPSFLHSCLISGEFPCKVGIADAIRMSPKLGTIRRVEDLDTLVQRWSHATHIFYASWGEFTPTLEDVHVLMKLPLFGDSDISSSLVGSHLIDMAKDLKNATIESAKYSREFLVKFQNDPVTFYPTSKTPPRKVRGTGNVLPPDKRKYFHFERFPEYAPVKAVPEPPLEGENHPLELRAWGWSMGRPRHSLLDLIDEEDQFVHRPYSLNLPRGVETLLHLYQEDAFHTRNNRSLHSEGVFDMWRLILHPQFLLLGIPSGLMLIARIARRQFGLDQPPCSVDIAFSDLGEAMKAVLSKTYEALSAFDSSKFVSSTRVGRVLNVWVAYYAKLRTSIKRYEREASQRAFPDVPIMCKTLIEGTSSKKRKSSSVHDTPKAVSIDRVPDTPVRKQGTTGSPKSKKEPARPTRASERLKAKAVPKDLPPTSPSNLLADTSKDVNEYAASSQGKDASFSPGDLSKAMVLATWLLLSLLPHWVCIHVACFFLFFVITSPPPFFDLALYLLVAQDLYVEVVPILGSLLSDDDAKILGEFSARHAGFLLPEATYPAAFLKPAYSFFAEFLRFIRSHHTIALLGTHKEKVMSDLKALSLFGLMSFPGVWIAIFLLLPWKTWTKFTKLL